jgi:hypothetical protein
MREGAFRQGCGGRFGRDNPFGGGFSGGLADMYEALGRTDDAIKDFEHILKISNNPELLKKADTELQKLKNK